jgi:hypothetical protein
MELLGKAPVHLFGQAARRTIGIQRFIQLTYRRPNGAIVALFLLFISDD